MHGWFWRSVGHCQVLLAVCLAALLTLSCKSSLSTNLDGLPCDEIQRCVAGYTCDVSSNSCRATPSCRNGETVCNWACVLTTDDPENCGGCGATCTAPAHGHPGCAGSRCSFGCDDGYTV